METKMSIQMASNAPTSFALSSSAIDFDLNLEAASADDGTPKRPTFSMVGYTGAPVRVGGYSVPIIVELSGIKLASPQIPILLNHDMDRLVGQTQSIKIDAKGIHVTGTITGDNEDAKEVVSQAKNGFKWQASIGASPDRREFLESGQKATVNGREVTGPMLISRDTTLGELSFVPLGADTKTSATVAASNSQGHRKGNLYMNFEQWVLAKGFDPATLDDTQRTSLKAAYDLEQKPKETPVQASGTSGGSLNESLDSILEKQRAENDRVNKITQLTASAVSGRPMMVDEYDTLARHAIEGKSSVQEFELALLRLRADSAPGVMTRNSPDSKTTAKVIEATLCRSGGLENLGKHFDERTLNASEDRFKRGLGLQELLLMMARENGFTGYSATDTEALLQAAFPSRNDIRASGGFSTLSLPGILGNTANKFLVAGFNAVESTWREIASFRNVKDFKTVTSYSLSGDMTYEKVGAAGELKHATLGETSYTNSAATYGRMLAITRQDIINDDLGALTQTPFRLGRGAALKLNDVFWTAFLAGVGSFWASGNANLLSGGTSALASAGLTLALAKFRKQTDPDGKPMALMPKILLVPPELEITADELMTSTAVNTGGSSSTDRVPNRNTWVNKFKPVVSTYLSNSSFTGYNVAAWFLLADPADMPTIEVAFLNGLQTPTVESAAADFETLGIKMRGYHDFGVSLQEYRGSLRSAGT